VPPGSGPRRRIGAERGPPRVYAGSAMRVLPLTLLLAGLLGPSAVRAEEEVGPGPIPPLETTGVLEGHEGVVRTLAFDPQGSLLASGGPDRTLRLWSLERAEEIAALRLPRGG